MHRNLAAAAVVILLSVLFLFPFFISMFCFILPFIQLWKFFEHRQNHKQRVAWRVMRNEARLLKLLVWHTFISHWDMCVCVCHTYIFRKIILCFMTWELFVFPSSHSFYLFLNDSTAAAAAVTTPVASAATVGLPYKIFMVMR